MSEPARVARFAASCELSLMSTPSDDASSSAGKQAVQLTFKPSIAREAWNRQVRTLESRFSYTARDLKAFKPGHVRT